MHAWIKVAILILILLIRNSRKKRGNKVKFHKIVSIRKDKNLPLKTAISKEETINFISYAQFKEIVSTHRLVVVFFYLEEKTNRKIMAKFRAIQRYLGNEKAPMLHVIVQQTEIGPENRELKNLPSVFLFIDSVGRRFNGELYPKDFLAWLKEALVADVYEIRNLSQIHKVDRHYYLYVKTKFLKKNDAQMTALAKLIYPIGVYSGMATKNEDNMYIGKSPKSQMWLYRKYDDRIIDIDLNLDIEIIMDTILENEHIRNFECSDHSIQMIREIKIPVLVYFASSNETSTNWQNVMVASEKYHEYLTPIFVGYADNNACSRFLTDYLEVEKKPSLRILNMHAILRRHLYVGNFETKSIRFFLWNYVQGNLKNYRINEANISEKWELPGIHKTNSKDVKKLLLGSNYENIIYAFSSDYQDLSPHLKLLSDLHTTKLYAYPRFRIYTLNMDKNDIGTKFLGDTPFVFVIKSDGKTVKFDPKLDAVKFMAFLKTEFKELSEIPTDL